MSESEAAGGLGSKPARDTSRTRRLFKWILLDADNAVNTAVVAGAGVVLFADELGWLKPSPESLSRLAITAIAGLALAQVTGSALRERIHREQTQRVRSIASDLEGLPPILESLRVTDHYQIPAANRDAELGELLGRATEWSFRGGSGRWQRSTVLPALSARRSNVWHYRMQIVDPRDRELCERYAHYRFVQRSPEVIREGESDVLTIVADLLGCIYATGWYQRNSTISPQVSLMPMYTPFRVDGDSRSLIITVANPKAMALRVSQGSWYHQALRDELDQATAELPTVVNPENARYYPSAWQTVTPDIVANALRATRVRDRNGSSSELLAPWVTELDGVFALVASRAFEGRK